MLIPPKAKVFGYPQHVFMKMKKAHNMVDKLEKNLKNHKADTGSNDYLSGYVDGFRDGTAKEKKENEDT